MKSFKYLENKKIYLKFINQRNSLVFNLNKIYIDIYIKRYLSILG